MFYVYTSVEQSALENIMPELVNGSTPRWPRDRRVMRALMELSRTDSVPTEPEEDVNDLVSGCPYFNHR